MKFLQGMVQRQAQEIKLLKEANENKEAVRLRNNLLISGLEEDDEESPDNLIQLVTDFFSQTMGIRNSITINNARHQGNANPHMIVVTLQNLKDKGIIFKHVKNLKDVRNINDDRYFITDHLPAARQEEQHRYRSLINQNKDKEGTDKFNLGFKKANSC